MEIKSYSLNFTKLKHVVFISFFLILSSYSFAKIIGVRTIQETYNLSDLVIIGNVKDIVPFKDNNFAIINNIDFIKGNSIKQKEIKVFFYGSINNPRTFADKAKRILKFSKGEKAILFLTLHENNFRVVQYHYGKLLIEGDNVHIPYYYQENDNLSAIEPFNKIRNILELFANIKGSE